MPPITKRRTTRLGAVGLALVTALTVAAAPASAAGPSITAPDGTIRPLGGSQVTGPSGSPWVLRSNVLFNTPATGAAFDATYAKGWRSYPNGTSDAYDRNRISAVDGALQIKTEMVNGKAVGAAGTFVAPDDGNPATDERDFLGGAFELVFQVLPLPGQTSAAYIGMVGQLWPSPSPTVCQFGFNGKPPSDGKGGCWEDGEMDFPEVFNSDTGQVVVFHHGLGERANQNILQKVTQTDLRVWHTARTEWIPPRQAADGTLSGGSVRYYLDGYLIGEVTDQANIPRENMRWVLQSAAGSSDMSNAAPGALIRIDRATSYGLGKAAGGTYTVPSQPVR